MPDEIILFRIAKSAFNQNIQVIRTFLIEDYSYEINCNKNVHGCNYYRTSSRVINLPKYGCDRCCCNNVKSFTKKHFSLLPQYPLRFLVTIFPAIGFPLQ